MAKRHKPKYCLVKGDGCECGRNGWAIKFCRRPLSSVRMAEIMEGLRVRVRTETAQHEPNAVESNVNETATDGA